jgi:hypothetical protein
MNYLVINSENIVVNSILWDGETPWSPPEGHTAILSTGVVEVGWSYIDGEFIPPLDNLSSNPTE